ncbi:MAG: macrolide ABC transporter ATP-binding protein [Actinomycetales bacterium]|nr:MAG: macrolide ABC transporter ATP-binding protein [Actinomycetales bacterium]
MDIICLQDVVKEFGKSGALHRVIDGLTLNVPAGSYLSIMGRSGSGKSTLLNIVAGMLRPSSGKVEVCNTDLTAASQNSAAAFRLSYIGFIFQAFHLLPRLSLWENVAVPLILRGGGKKQRLKSLACAELDRFGLGDLAEKRPATLSGGQQQRVAIARALVTKPKLVLADEPTGNLDQESAVGVLEAFAAIRRDHDSTLVVVTHDTDVAQHADSRVEMIDGRLVGESR